MIELMCSTYNHTILHNSFILYNTASRILNSAYHTIAKFMVASFLPLTVNSNHVAEFFNVFQQTGAFQSI